MDKPESGSNTPAPEASFNQPLTAVDNNPSSSDAPGVGEFSDAMMKRPDYVPEKFFKDGRINIKAMAESFGELERKQSQAAPKPESTPAPGPSDKPADQNAAPAPAAGDKPADQNQAPAIVIPGVNQQAMEHYTKEITEGGKLSDNSYADLAKLGYPKSVVDSYVKGLQADAMVNNAISDTKIAMTETSAIIEGIGGAKELGSMLEWAGSNLTPQELAVYNEAVSGSDAAKVKMAVHGMYHAYKQAQGPDLFGGRPPVPNNLVPFKTGDDVVRAMEDPRYDIDPEYRAEVAARIAASNVFAGSREYKTRDSY